VGHKKRARDWGDIAIIGMSGRFPGASNISEFWQNLHDGVESVRVLEDEELARAGVDSAALENPHFVPVGSVIDAPEFFDAYFFGYSPREAESLDPQQRLFLETSWLALEDAGYDPNSFPGLIGVYGGCAMSTYLRQLEANPEFMALLGYLQVYIGNDKDYLTTHVSYKLGLRGPSFSVQTACSTSLLAVAVAADHLLSGQCDMALAGGVCVRAPQETGYYYEPGGIFSPDGHCRVFDEQAAGVVFGNGVGVVVLKRLSDALADGDAIDAIVKGWAVNNDGSAKTSYAAPSLEGQAAVIKEAQRRAGVSASTITYVEAHGTGTSLGDPIEIAALTSAFNGSGPNSKYCAVGSVKTNIGHLDPAAGVASLVKTVLALQHKQIPPSLHCNKPSPAIDFENSPFYVNGALADWTVEKEPRRAGVSGFGIGGTNVHLVLEEAPVRTPRPDGKDHHLLVLSARTQSALDNVISNLARVVKENDDLPAADIAYTSQVGRRAFGQRCALVHSDSADLLKALAAGDPRRLLQSSSVAMDRHVAFMFSGQGSQHVDMGRGLYESEPVFRRAVDICADILRPHLDIDLRSLLYPNDDRVAEADARLTRTEFAQPALFTVEYALATLWQHLGVQPDVAMGHSIGEYVAACLAGVLSLPDALALVAARGHMMQQLPAGAMLAVSLAESELQSCLDDEVDLAATNELKSCVVSGTTAAIARMRDRLAAQGVTCRLLHTSHAFHSRMMDPLLDEFRDRVGAVTLHRPRMRYVSNVTGDWISSAQATDPAYWANHLRLPVRWAQGLCRILEEPARALVEVGPGQALTTFVARHPDRSASHHVVASMRHPHDARDDSSFFLESVGRLWLSGAVIDWSAMHQDNPRDRVHLPGYPFERQRYWVDDSEPELEESSVIEKEPDIADWFYVPSWEYSIIPEDDGAPATPTLVFDDGAGIGAAVIDILRKRGEDLTVVTPGRTFAAVAEGHYEIDPATRDHYFALVDALAAADRVPRRVVHLWSLGVSEPEESEHIRLDQEQQSGFYSLLYLAQALIKQCVSEAVQIVVASNNLHSVTGEERLCPAKATLLGVCRAVPQEYSNLMFRSVDIEFSTDGSSADNARLLVAEFSDPELASTVAYRKGQRWLQIFEPVRLVEANATIVTLRPQGVYLITGGLGNVGLALAGQLADAVRARLVLVARSIFLPRENWDVWLSEHEPDDETSDRIRQVRLLEDCGAEVLILSADVGDDAALQAVIDRTYEHFGRLDGVIHAAGNVTADGFFGIDEADPNKCEQQFRAKVRGLIALEKAIQGKTLDFVVLVSSISSVLAGLGYVAYSAANTFMDVFAQKYSDRTGIPWVSINWDSWDFDESADFDPAQLTMHPKEGTDAFERILCGAMVPQVIVSTGDLQRRTGQWVSLTALRDAKQANASHSSRMYSRPDIATPYVKPRNALESSIAEMWQQALGVGDVGVFDNFFNELGGSSLLATQLTARLRERFQVDLPLRRLFEGPTVADLAEAIAAATASATPQSAEDEMAEEPTA
jgi:acyl transferase domain-containing protein/acyl carrier protein